MPTTESPVPAPRAKEDRAGACSGLGGWAGGDLRWLRSSRRRLGSSLVPTAPAARKRPGFLSRVVDYLDRRAVGADGHTEPPSATPERKQHTTLCNVPLTLLLIPTHAVRRFRGNVVHCFRSMPSTDSDACRPPRCAALWARLTTRRSPTPRPNFNPQPPTPSVPMDLRSSKVIDMAWNTRSASRNWWSAWLEWAHRIAGAGRSKHSAVALP